MYVVLYKPFIKLRPSARYLYDSTPKLIASNQYPNSVYHSAATRYKCISRHVGLHHLWLIEKYPLAGKVSAGFYHQPTQMDATWNCKGKKEKLMNSVGLRYPSVCLRGERVKCLKRHKLNTRLPVIIIHTSCRHHKALISTGFPLKAPRNSTLQTHPHCCRVLLCRVSYTQPNN